MDSKFLPLHFVEDVYLPYLKSLLEADHTEDRQIYEFSAQYFEEKVAKRDEQSKETKESVSSTEQDIPTLSEFEETKVRVNAIERDIPTWFGSEVVHPDFSYDSYLILPVQKSSESLNRKNMKETVVIQGDKDAAENIQNSLKSPKDLDISDESKLENNMVIKQMINFNKLLPGYVDAMADFLHCFGEDDKTLEKLTIPQKSDDSRQLEREDAECASDGSKEEDKKQKHEALLSYRTIETQTVVIGDWQCKNCILSQKANKSPSVLDTGKTKSNRTTETQTNVTGEWQCKNCLLSKKASKSPTVQDTYSSSETSPETLFQINQCLTDTAKKLISESATYKVSKESIPPVYPPLETETKATNKDSISEDATSSQCVHLATSKLRAKIQRFSTLDEKKVREAHASYSKEGDYIENILPVTGRTWLRTYFTVRMIRNYQKETDSEKVSADEGKYLGMPVLKCHTYKPDSFLKRYHFFSRIRLWYFARKFRKYEGKGN